MLKARFISFVNGVVALQKADGPVVNVPLELRDA
jgi:hypothetical protein